LKYIENITQQETGERTVSVLSENAASAITMNSMNDIVTGAKVSA
jgi:hypothetical protein